MNSLEYFKNIFENRKTDRISLLMRRIEFLEDILISKYNHTLSSIYEKDMNINALEYFKNIMESKKTCEVIFLKQKIEFLENLLMSKHNYTLEKIYEDENKKAYKYILQNLNSILCADDLKIIINCENLIFEFDEEVDKLDSLTLSQKKYLKMKATHIYDKIYKLLSFEIPLWSLNNNSKAVQFYTRQLKHIIYTENSEKKFKMLYKYFKNLVHEQKRIPEAIVKRNLYEILNTLYDDLPSQSKKYDNNKSMVMEIYSIFRQVKLNNKVH